MLQGPLGLRQPEIKPLLAPIVDHAIQLTRMLGERHLWIDALCIDHSDKELTITGLAIMGSIYASAVLTIVVTHTDAQDGLPGIRGDSGSRASHSSSQTLIPWGQAWLRQQTVYKLTENAYYRLGWTFQEALMARRRLVLSHTGLHWLCEGPGKQSCLSEDTSTSVDWYAQFRAFKIKNILKGIPDIDELSCLLANYAGRSLILRRRCTCWDLGSACIRWKVIPRWFPIRCSSDVLRQCLVLGR